jgi:FkbM family methyltransferase
VDLGANIGLYTLMLRRASSLPIVSYEPQSFLFRLLQWNIELNKSQNITAHNAACGSQKGELPMVIGANGSIREPQGQELRESAPATNWEDQALEAEKSLKIAKVPVVTLDENLAGLGRVALLKIDCEGYEQHILLGARHLLERDRPHLFIELHPAQLRYYGHSVRDVVELLVPAYELQFWSFEHRPSSSKLGRSLAKCRPPKSYCYASTAEMLRAAQAESLPGKLYCVGRPKQVSQSEIAL